MREIKSFTFIFKNQYTGKNIGGNKTFTVENFKWANGYSHNRFTITAKTIEGKAIRPKSVKMENGKLYAV